MMEQSTTQKEFYNELWRPCARDWGFLELGSISRPAGQFRNWFEPWPRRLDKFLTRGKAFHQRIVYSTALVSAPVRVDTPRTYCRSRASGAI